MKAIRAVVAQIVERWHPEKIILFGSHAYGKPNADSDVDLLVIMPVEGNRAHLTGEIRAAIHVLFPIDLIVRTPEWIESRLAIDDLIVKEWLQAGCVLHESGSGKLATVASVSTFLAVASILASGDNHNWR